MKISPPEPNIDPSDPFKEALFERKAFADSVTALLRNTSESLVMLVHAPWGEGKTTFAKMWLAELRRLKLNAVYFNAYAADYHQDPLICFAGEIHDFIGKYLPENKSELEPSEFKKKTVEVSKRLASLAAKLAIKSATLGLLEEAHFKAIKEAGDIATGVAELGASIIEKKIESYGLEKDSLADFRKTLSNLGALFRAEQSFPLTIVVDELDRCRPDFALSLLERIKHLFDVQNVAFVLLVNRDQIESYVKTVYGDVDARSYLLKFANLFVDLPHRSDSQMRYIKGRRDYCETLFVHYELRTLAHSWITLQEFLQVLVEHFAVTLREMEKACALLSLYCGSVPKNEFSNDYLVGALALLKVVRPQLYGQLRAQSISLEKFFGETKLDQLKGYTQRLDLDWAKKIIFACLMSDSEFQEAVRTDSDISHYRDRYVDVEEYLGAIRKSAIPLHCSRLDRFAFKP